MIYTNLIFAMTAIPSFASVDFAQQSRDVMGHFAARQYIHENRERVHQMRKELAHLWNKDTQKFANVVNNYAIGGQWAKSGVAGGEELARRVVRSVKYIEVLHDLAVNKHLINYEISQIYVDRKGMSIDELRKEMKQLGIEVPEVVIIEPAKKFADERQRRSRSNTSTPTAEELEQKVANMKKCRVWDLFCFCGCNQSDDSDMLEHDEPEPSFSDQSDVTSLIASDRESDSDTKSPRTRTDTAEYSNNEPTVNDDEKYDEERKTNDDHQPDHIIEVQELEPANRRAIDASKARQMGRAHEIKKAQHVPRNNRKHKDSPDTSDCDCDFDCTVQ